MSIKNVQELLMVSADFHLIFGLLDWFFVVGVVSFKMRSLPHALGGYISRREYLVTVDS